MQEQVQETKHQLQETKHELTVLVAVQEETKQKSQDAKQRISTMEGKIDAVLALLQGGR
jgi:hypothetical protein